MKIIKRGEIKKIRTCENCNTTFEYDDIDIHNWENTWVNCPVCDNALDVSTKWDTK